LNNSFWSLPDFFNKTVYLYYMYFVSATRLKLRSIFFLPALFKADSAATRQLVITPGFVKGKQLFDKGLTFWTLTMWTDADAMKVFRNSPPHQMAMRKLPDWCSEGTYNHWIQESDEFPDWYTVHDKIVSEGKITKVRKPSRSQLSKSFPKPQWSKTETKYKPV